MNGQWLGTYSGTNSGVLVIDIDDQGSHYEGHAYAFDEQENLSATIASIVTPDKSSSQTLRVPLHALSKETGREMTDEAAAAAFPGIGLPRSASATFAVEAERLSVSATTDIGTSITAILPRTAAALPSEFLPLEDVQTWAQFKTFAARRDYRGFIFRGQSKPHRLRTLYHRSGRADIGLYMQHDIPNLHRRLSARTRHLFDLEKGAELGAFLCLAQHHGYPTPLLDWTYSPFIAAFFAYRKTDSVEARTATPDAKVRIFILDQDAWRKSLPQVLSLRPYGLNFSVLEVLPIDNERMIPQQSVTTVTNVDNIENYIRDYGTLHGRQYLRVVDLPLAERSLVMGELSIMGITAGSMFPNLDGACEELKEKLFP
jgi:hypothetical protein